MSGNEIQKWADAAMYRSESMPSETRATGGGVKPKVTLINATPDPLGNLAVLCGIYKGEVRRGLHEVTDADRYQALEDMRRTQLDGPLECINFTFLVEGVSRALTHQAVRNRFSFFAQESMRFAVVEGDDWKDRQAYPPSLAAKPRAFENGDDNWADLSPEEKDYSNRRDYWDGAMKFAQDSYTELVDAGMPAEDARGLMPHSIATRYYWQVNYRALVAEAGKRLCTQAQFEWRLMMASLAEALREYASRYGGWMAQHGWQFEALAATLRPVCYAAGRCTFMADFDRNCSIRERVNFRADNGGKDSTKWHLPLIADRVAYEEGTGRPYVEHVTSPGIEPSEWLLNPAAAR